jgi:hypothetical protein
LLTAIMPAHCGAPALVPPTWNHPVCRWYFTLSYTEKPVLGSAL